MSISIRSATCILVVLCLFRPATAQTPHDLKRDGAFGFPQARAQVLCDEPTLRLSVINDDSYLVVQAIVWNDHDDSLGETADGRPIGDTSSICVKVDPAGTTTVQRDRTYSLNPWPAMPGLFYQVQIQPNAFTGLQSEPKGRGAIRYVQADGKKVRVDTFVIPLANLQKQPGDKLRLAYWGKSPKPDLTVNSVGHQAKGAYYSFALPASKYHTLTLAADNAALNLAQIPDGHDDPCPLPKRDVKPMPQVGSAAPEVSAKDWINTTKPPRLSDLRDQVILVEFWATWCGPCVKGIPHLNEMHNKYASKGLRIMSFTDQSRQGIEAFLKQTPIKYTIGAGSDLAAAYGVTGIPYAFLVGKDGKILWHGQPSEPELEKRIGMMLESK